MQWLLHLNMSANLQTLEWFTLLEACLKIHTVLDFPGGAVVKNPPANARDTGSNPGPGGSRMPHAAEQLSPCATTVEPAL